MSERRIDAEGRDVTDLPGLWSESDRIASEQIEPGEGWRLLRDKEHVLAFSDEHYWLSDKSWHSISPNYHLREAGTFTAVRRRIPSKSEAMKIDHQTIKCNSFDEVMQIDEDEVWRLVSNAQQARQLAEWLNRYADWREAHGEK